jgi:hypothetical protein
MTQLHLKKHGLMLVRGSKTMNKSLLLCARDIQIMYQSGISYSKALRHMQYILAPYEVAEAKRDLIRHAQAKRRVYNEYKSNMFDKYYHSLKQKGANV